MNSTKVVVTLLDSRATPRATTHLPVSSTYDCPLQFAISPHCYFPVKVHALCFVRLYCGGFVIVIRWCGTRSKGLLSARRSPLARRYPHSYASCLVWEVQWSVTCIDICAFIFQTRILSLMEGFISVGIHPQLQVMLGCLD